MKSIPTRILVLVCAILGFTANANNIAVSNISLENLNSGNQTVMVQFDLSWENSWRLSVGPSNWDAAWAFVKYRANSGDWLHATLNVVAPVTTGVTTQVSSDLVGAMIFRDGDGSGNVNFTGVQLQWDFGLDGVTENDILDIQVFAIEMVYVPEGPFSVGGTSGDEANKFHEGGNTTTSYQVTSENAITIANSSGNLFYTSESANGGDHLGPIPANYPKGFQAFYCMKYEVSESQWIGFFNSLTETQKLNRDVTDNLHKGSDLVVNRNTIAWTGGSANATSAAPDRALNYINAFDINAYMDWAGLRPMTELEYEKACRGPIAPKPGEFAWGNANISSIEYVLINDGLPNEMISNPEVSTGNTLYSGTNGLISGAVRNGIFAASAVNNSREETGGSYYGIMELSGNVYERAITVGNPRGRLFAGDHGNGVLTTSGDHNVPAWPLSNGDGYGYRGASYINNSVYLRVSDRTDGANTFQGMNSRIGFRCARTDL